MAIKLEPDHQQLQNTSHEPNETKWWRKNAITYNIVETNNS